MAKINFGDNDPTASGGFPAVGKCQAMVMKVVEREERIDVTASVVAHEKETEVGKTFPVFLQLAGKQGAVNRTRDFAIAVGLATKEDFIAIKEKGESSWDGNFEAAAGERFCCSIVMGKDQFGNPRPGVGFDFFAPDSPEADGYPKANGFDGESDDTPVF